MGRCEGACLNYNDSCGRCGAYGCSYRDCSYGRPTLSYEGYCSKCEDDNTLIESIMDKIKLIAKPDTSSELNHIRNMIKKLGT